jgi:hypothetical protein
MGQRSRSSGSTVYPPPRLVVQVRVELPKHSVRLRLGVVRYKIVARFDKAKA